MATRQEWFTVRDLVGMPGMPRTERGVQLWGQKNLANARPKERGKGLEYSRASLPEETRQHLDDLDLQVVLQQLPPPPETTHGQLAPVTPQARALARATADEVAAHATPEQRLRGLARALTLRTLRGIAAVQGLSHKAAARQLLEHARTGQLAPALLSKVQESCDERGRDAGRGDGLPSVPTLLRWLRLDARCQGLVPRPSAVADLQVRGWYRPFFALTDRPQKPTLRQCHEQLLSAWRPEWADSPGAPPPTYQRAVYAYNKRSALDRLKGRHTGSALRARTFFHKRTYAGMAPFTEVHSDGWTTHWTAPHPVTGEFVTYELWHFHDVATRYVTPMAVGMTESSDVILEGLQRCIRVGGVPAIWQTDHTSSVKNRKVMDEHAGLADRLGISVVHPATVGNSQANGIAENFNTWLDREARALATYQHPSRMDSGTFVKVRRITNAMVRAGDQPEQRAALRAQAMKLGKGIVFDSHQQALDWIAELQRKWNAKPHRELPRLQDAATGRWVHMTPQQSLDAALAAGWEPMLLPENVLVDQFRPHLRKKIVRGTVTPFNGQRYHHADLAHHEGEEVLVAVDRADPAKVWVKDLQGRLIAVADFVAAVKSRTESMAEHSARKRAEAQIRLREQQIEQIEERIAPPALEMPAAPVFELSRDVPLRPERALPPEEPLPVPLRPVTQRQADDDERPLTFLESEMKLQALEERMRAERAKPGAGDGDGGDELKRVAAG